MPTDDMFADRADRYDALIDWDKRLANESAFYRRLFEEVGAKRVLDAACGTGRHAAMFREWGLQVVGTDVSPAMLAKARENFGESEGLQWIERSFTVAADDGPFDVVLCTGNSLSLAEGHEVAREAVRAMLQGVKPGGALVVQVLNLWKLEEGPTLWQKSKRLRFRGRDTVLLKGIHRVGGRGHIDLVELTLTDDGVERQEHGAMFEGIHDGDLLVWAQDAGASRCDLWGSVQREPYDRTGSTDLILVARK
jgi:SAM-dependent methyltransferase